jgi:hypothetical protein
MFFTTHNGTRSQMPAYRLFIFASETGGNQPVARLQLPRQSLSKVLANFFIHVADTNLAQTLDEV